ncbi:MAG: hypothetical protein LBQ57_06865, partial [Spirochaetales bacterium]|nr:hypothetical protein [Spirochaetales bacterium]
LSGGSAAGAATSRPFNPLRPTDFKKWCHFGTGSHKKRILTAKSKKSKTGWPQFPPACGGNAITEMCGSGITIRQLLRNCVIFTSFGDNREAHWRFSPQFPPACGGHAITEIAEGR